ncbi:MAG: cytochrome C [Desulfuromonas sp.]|nr:MAG: cytochrome C [Desulfuromonas sp.]
MSFNSKTLRKLILLALVSVAAVAFGSTAFAYDHNAVTLKDASGAEISLDADDVGNAYSVQATCGGCHDYDAYEQHSYHSQLAANEHYGFNPMNPDGDVWESGPGPKGKAWVQGQGHVGAW